MLILQDAQSDFGIRKIASFCQTSPQFIDLVNRAVRKLLRRGDFMGTVVPIYVCVYNGCVVWPRYVQAVRRLSICNQPLSVRNLWYDFMEGVRYNSNNWTFNYLTGVWYQSAGALLQQGKTSVFQDVQGDGRLIRAYARCPEDYDKTLTIFGIDNNGQQIQTDNGDGTYSMGAVLTLGPPFASTTMYVRSIEYVIKDVTQCPVNLYAYNASTNLLEDLAQYDPSETRPSYEKTRLESGRGLPCCNAAKGVMALVKLKYIPAIAPTDPLFIDNLDALQIMIQSIKSGEAGDRATSLGYESDAIRELNRDIETQSPDAQFAAIDNTFGGITFTQQCF